MAREVPAVHESATLEEIFDPLVLSTHKRVVVVDDDRRVVGVIADSDSISRASRRKLAWSYRSLGPPKFQSRRSAALRVNVSKSSGPAPQRN